MVNVGGGVGGGVGITDVVVGASISAVYLPGTAALGFDSLVCIARRLKETRQLKRDLFCVGSP